MFYVCVAIWFTGITRGASARSSRGLCRRRSGWSEWRPKLPAPRPWRRKRPRRSRTRYCRLRVRGTCGYRMLGFNAVLHSILYFTCTGLLFVHLDSSVCSPDILVYGCFYLTNAPGMDISRPAMPRHSNPMPCMPF